MSRRNSRENKKRRKLLKNLRTPLPSHIDLIDYVQSRTRCTTGTAKKVLLSGALMVESHPVGFKYNDKGVKYLHPYLPTEKYSELRIVKPKDEDFDKLGLAAIRNTRDA